MYKGLEAVVSGLNLTNEVFGFYTGSPIYPNQREFYKPTVIFGMRWSSAPVENREASTVTGEGPDEIAAASGHDGVLLCLADASLVPRRIYCSPDQPPRIRRMASPTPAPSGFEPPAFSHS